MAKATAKRSGRTIPPLQVRYPRRMKPQRVYSVQVSWRSTEKNKLPAGTPPFTVRLVMAGAQVVPSELPMDPTQPRAKATFYVTSLARRGWLKGERLEVLAEGEKVQEIGLPTKVTNQRTTLLLLLLTFLIPWFLVTQIQITDDEYMKNLRQGGAFKQMINYLHVNTPLPAVDINDMLTTGVESIGMTSDLIPGAYSWVHRVIVRDEMFTAEGKEDAYLAFWIGAILLVLTVLSWFCHREKKRTKVGQPLPIPGEGD